MPSVTDSINRDRNFIYGVGDQLRNNAGYRGDRANEQYRQYESLGKDAYLPFLEGGGGYREHEVNDIMGRDRLDDLQLRPDEVEGSYLSSDEYNRIAGSPWDRAAFFNPAEDWGLQVDSADRQRGVVDQYGNDATGAINADDLRLSGTYDQQMQGALQGGSSRVRGAIDPTRLRLSNDFVNRYRMSDDELQSRLDTAGMDSKVVNQAAMDRATMAARGAGMDPLGIASYVSRAARDGRIDAADNLTRERGRALGERAGRERDIEGMRLGAEGGLSRSTIDAELALQGRELSAAGDRERLRMGAEQGLADRRLDVASRRAGIASGTEQAINQQGRDVRQFNTTTGTNMATGIERDSADRARWLAENRQGTQQRNTDQRFQRGSYRDQNLAGRTGATAGARRDDQQEARRWATGMTGMNNEREQAEYNRQNQLYQTQGALAAGSTQSQLQQDQRPKWWQSLLSGAVNAI